MRSSQKNADPDRFTTTSLIEQTLKRPQAPLPTFQNDPFSISKLNFEVMETQSVPLKNHPESDYNKISGNLSHSFHDIYKMKRVYNDPNKPSYIFFFKKDKHEITDQCMYELEAALCSFYHFVAPDHSPTAHAIYNEKGRYIGIAVKKLDSFCPAIDDPLLDSDLEIEALKNCTISDLEEVDARAMNENLNLKDLLSKKIIDSNTIIHYVIKRHPETNEIQRIPITVKDLRNFRTVKGLAIGLTTSLSYGEDDNHTGNMSKDGKRIDFDMSEWEILYWFKLCGVIDWTLRNPNGRFNITAYDIEHSPNIVNAQPFYWCTKSIKALPEAFISAAAASKLFPVSRNAFLSKDNSVYQKLETHPVYVHYKYATYLKLALTKKEHYKNISELHIRSELSYQSTSIIDLISNYTADRMQKIREELIKIPAFKDFMIKNGETVIKDIVLDFAEYNDKFQRKLDEQPLYKKQIIDLTQIIDDFASICKELNIPVNIDSIKNDAKIIEIIHENKILIDSPTSASKPR